MSNERTILAIGRIERALSKLEQYRPPLAQSGATQTEASDLQIRHERLKSEAKTAIAQIDRLLSEGAG